MKEERLTKLRKLILGGRKRTFSKGQVFQYSNDRQELSLVVSGFVKRYSITSRGTLGVQIIFGRGDVFPLTHMYKVLLDLDINKSQEVYYYEAMSSTEVYAIDNQTLLEAVDKDSGLYKDLLLEAGYRLESNIQQLENLSLHSSYCRVAHQLYILAQKFGEPTKLGVKINAPITQQDLADIMGTSRETISMAISKLREKELILSKRSIVIPDLLALQNEATG